jgi:hypothetical protein
MAELIDAWSLAEIRKLRIMEDEKSATTPNDRPKVSIGKATSSWDTEWVLVEALNLRWTDMFSDSFKDLGFQ